MPASKYGDPQFPERLNYAASSDQRRRVQALAETDEFESLGEVLRTLVDEALEARMAQQAGKDQTEADEANPFRRRPAAVPVGIARVGGQLVKPLSLPADEVDTAAARHPASRRRSRAELIAEERGTE